MRKFLFLALLCPFLSMCQPISLKGKIINEQHQPVAGATITVKRVTNDPARVTATISNSAGEFSITHLGIGDTIIVTAVGYEAHTEYYDYTLTKGSGITIMLTRKVSVLDEAVIIAYGNTTRRLSTSAISTVKSEDIARQPVSNPLSALEGMVPGLVVTQANGLPGSAFSVQLRGRSSIATENDPLFVIDGVPFAPNNSSTSSGMSSALGSSGPSPFSVINPLDIERIEVLKDADATAIYGSRGANGVVLITTKKGSAGKINVSASASTGWSRVARTRPFLDTRQYLQMRREAFENDSLPMTTIKAYDLLVFDTTRYTNFTDYFIGHTARQHTVNTSLSGGTAQSQFLLSAAYNRQTTVFPGSMHDDRLSVHSSFRHQSPDKKFSLAFSGTYAWENNQLNSRDLTQYLTLAPNWFSFFDSTGSLVWQYGGLNFDNPMSYLLKTYELDTYSLLSSLSLSYKLTNTVFLKADLGYNQMNTSELSKIPKASQSPGSSSLSGFGDSRFTAWSAEPQLHYVNSWAKLTANILLGTTLQANTRNLQHIVAGNYANDALLGSLAAAGNVMSKSNSQAPYRYQAVFGRMQYNWDNKYLLSLSGRRDGSSRFGTGHQYGNFGAAGMGWIISNERFFKHVGAISFAKLRASYGSTGNDNIGEYQYLDAWSSALAYQGNGTLVPSHLSNPAYGWEVNRKLEMALELGAFNDRLLLSASWYRNRCSNQLVDYPLPSQTGFTSIVSNFPALVENEGWECELSFTVLKREHLQWTFASNISFPKNTLLSFPGIESTSYAKLVVGQPLSVYGGFRFLGVDPQTGTYIFADKDKKPTISPSESTDWITNLGNLEPKFYGGITSSFSFHGLSLSLLCDFRRQPGLTWQYQLSNRIPGTIYNLPVDVLDHWTAPGDVVTFPMYTQSYTSPAYTSASNFSFYDNSGKYGDASFLRLRNASLSYSLPGKLIQRWNLQKLSCYVQGQNLHSFTAYKGFDPETQSINTLPPLRTIAVGISITF